MLVSLLFISLSISVFPPLLLLLPVIILGIVLILKAAAGPTSQSLRYNAVFGSEVNSLFASSLESLASIRAYRQGPAFIARMNGLADRNSTAYFTYISLSRWMSQYIELLMQLFIVGTLLAAYLSNNWSPSG